MRLETIRLVYFRMEWIHHADETGEDICMSNVRNYKRTDQELKEDRGDVAERILRPVQK